MHAAEDQGIETVVQNCCVYYGSSITFQEAVISEKQTTKHTHTRDFRLVWARSAH